MCNLRSQCGLQLLPVKSVYLFMYIVKYKYTDNLIYLYIKIGTQITVVMVLKILILNTTRTEGLETKNLMMVKVRIKSTFPLMNVVAFKLVSLQFSQELWL